VLSYKTYAAISYGDNLKIKLKCPVLQPNKQPRRFAPCRLDADDILGVGNVGDNSVTSYRLHASETQQLAHDANPSVICVELLGAAVSQCVSQ